MVKKNKKLKHFIKNYTPEKVSRHIGKQFEKVKKRKLMPYFPICLYNASNRRGSMKCSTGQYYYSSIQKST